MSGAQAQKRIGEPLLFFLAFISWQATDYNDYEDNTPRKLLREQFFIKLALILSRSLIYRTPI